MNFKNYVWKNGNTISLQTKMTILTDVLATLRQLRNHSIVYNNLGPSTVLVKQGLISILSDFTNAFRSGVAPLEHGFQDRFPYVSVSHKHSRSYQYEKNDSMSFGVLMFSAVYGKELKNVKSSSMKRLYA